MELERSIEIHAPVEQVFALVADLGKWRPWNPWLVTEPGVDLQVAPDGKHYRWQGKRTGAGEMRITAEALNARLDLDLVFLKPFKSQAKVYFTFEPEGDGCRVTWGMQGALPFFLFFLIKTMTALIGMDYERGLRMLKDYAETGTVPSQIEEHGPVTFPGCTYVGLTTECTLGELADRMSADFERLRGWAASCAAKSAGDWFSTYRKWDLANGRVRYTVGLPVAVPPAEVSTPFEVGQIPELQAFVLVHTGPYRHLGNAWSLGMQMGRGKEFRVSKAHPPFETYPAGAEGTPPGAHSDETTRTLIHFPIR